MDFENSFRMEGAGEEQCGVLVIQPGCTQWKIGEEREKGEVLGSARARLRGVSWRDGRRGSALRFGGRVRRGGGLLRR